MSDDILKDFNWHSAFGLDGILESNYPKIASMANNAKNRKLFVASSDNTLIHKTTKALWKISEDGKRLEAVFSTDILTNEDCEGIL